MARALDEHTSDRTNVPAEPIGRTSGRTLFDGYLCLLADSLDDMERTRIAAENRVRSLTRNVPDEDGITRGLGLDARSPEVAQAIGLVEGLRAIEHGAELALKRAFRTHPLYPWVKAQKGLGDKQTARLLATIGDPYWNDLHNRPRTVSELWAYSGYAVHDGHAQARRRGEKANWSAAAKMRAFLIAESCVKAGGDYATTYRDARTKYEGATHEHECRRCGPTGKPAQPGSALSKGHPHARALRAVAKEVLKGLWIEARRIHEGDAF